jgi:hypothetical protein
MKKLGEIKLLDINLYRICNAVFMQQNTLKFPMKSFCIKRVLRRIFVPVREKITRGWRKLYNEEFHNFCSLYILVLG